MCAGADMNANSLCGSAKNGPARRAYCLGGKMNFSFIHLSKAKPNTNTREKFLLGAILADRYGKELRREFRFCPNRKFRADWYIPKLNAIVEYEGVCGRGTSRHTTSTGYSNDCEKYNLAQIMGYKVLRYTAQNFMQVRADLDELEEDLKVGGSV